MDRGIPYECDSEELDNESPYNLPFSKKHNKHRSKEKHSELHFHVNEDFTF